jgi:hypothetical protein
MNIDMLNKLYAPDWYKKEMIPSWTPDQIKQAEELLGGGR